MLIKKQKGLGKPGIYEVGVLTIVFNPITSKWVIGGTASASDEAIDVTLGVFSRMETAALAFDLMANGLKNVTKPFEWLEVPTEAELTGANKTIEEEKKEEKTKDEKGKNFAQRMAEAKKAKEAMRK